MGTRSVTVVTSQWDAKDPVEHNATIYRHWDGYLDGHGRWLADFLEDVVVTNGQIDGVKNFNGPGRLACGIVAAMQEDDLNPDLMKQGVVCGQEFEYQVHVKYGSEGGEIGIRVLDGPMTAFGMGGEECGNEIFNGTVKEFDEFIKEAEITEKLEMAGEGK